MKPPTQTCAFKNLGKAAKCRPWRFSKFRYVEWLQMEHILCRNRTSQALPWKLI